MVAPALPYIRHDFNITSSVTEQMILSVFVLSYGLGPLLLGPLSEVYGRLWVLQLGNFTYLIFNVACGLSRTATQIIFFRLLSGLGGGTSLAIGGILSDCFTAEERGRAVAVCNLAPLLGPSLGPIAGAWLTQYTRWRWTFWVSSLVDGVIQIVGLVFLRVTYAPIILAKRAKVMRKATGNIALKTPYSPGDEHHILSIIGTALLRPLLMMTTQPIVFFLSFYYAYIYGLMYLVLSTFLTLWQTVYHESTSIAGLNYISLGLRYFVGSQIYNYLKSRHGRLPRAASEIHREEQVSVEEPVLELPEYRIPLMVPGSMLIPSGLLIYGLTAAAHAHWIFPDIGTFLFSLQ
jgi:multidrug resistance protein